MKIIYVVHDMYVGGIATVVNNLMNGMSNCNHEIHIVILKNTSKETVVLCKNIITLNIINKQDYIRGLIKLRKIIKDINPDIVHCHTVLSHILVLSLKNIFYPKLKVVCTEHGSLALEKNNYFIYKLFGFLSRAANEITFVSDFSLNSYLESKILTSKNYTRVIYNGINNKKENAERTLKIKEELEILDDVTNLCYIGRLSPEKNLEMMIKAMKVLENKKIRLIIVGDNNSEYKNKLIQLIKDLKLKNIDLIGHRSDVIDIINSVDCLLLTSFTEGLPTVVIEAYSQRKLVVSTVCGGIQEIIEDERFLAENNNLNDFVDKIKFYLSLKEREDELFVIYNLNYMKFHEKFHVNTMVDNFYKLYEGIIHA